MRLRYRYFVAAAGLCLLVLFNGACQKAGTYYQDGREAFAAGEYETAVLRFGQALEENPNKAEYYIEQGFAYTALERYGEAREAFGCAVVEQEQELIRKNNKRAWRGIGISYYKEGSYAAAREYLEKALAVELLPELDTDLRMYLAAAMEQEGDYAAAAGVYDALLAAQPDYAEGYRVRAQVNELLGAYEKSLSDYETAITLLPDSFELYLGKYNVLGKLGRQKEQEEFLKVLVEIGTPTVEDSWFIARAHFFHGDYDTALAELSEAVENGYDEAHYYIGEICRERADYDKAVYHYTAYIDGSGAGDAAGYNQKAVCLVQMGMAEEALEVVLAGQKLSDKEQEQKLFFNEIVILEKTGDYNTAYERAAAYIKRYPDDAAGWAEAEFLSTRVRQE